MVLYVLRAERVPGACNREFWVQGSGLRVAGVGFRIEGFGLRFSGVGRFWVESRKSGFRDEG